MANLRNQFEQALTNIEINGEKRKRAIDAHTEIRELAATGRAVEGMGRRAAVDRLIRPGGRHLSRQGCGRFPALHQAGHGGRAQEGV